MVNASTVMEEKNISADMNEASREDLKRKREVADSSAAEQGKLKLEADDECTADLEVQKKIKANPELEK